jgi:PAS domain S-box-containing protein
MNLRSLSPTTNQKNYQSDDVDILLVSPNNTDLPIHSKLSEISLPTDTEIQFHHVTTADAALSTLDKVPIQCIISEQDLPHTTGLDILEQVRVSDQRLPFILWPENPSPELPTKAISNDVTQYLPQSSDKGFSQLQAVLQSVLEDHLEQPDPEEVRERELELERHQYLSQTIQDLAGIGVLEYHIDDDRLLTTKGVGTLLGVSDLSEMSLDDALTVIHPLDLNKVERKITECVLEQIEVTLSFRLQTEATQYVQLHCQPVTNSDDRTVMVRGVIQDITGEREYDKYLSQIQQIDGLGLFQATPFKDQMWASQGLHSILNISETADLSFQDFRDAVHTDDWETFRDMLKIVDAANSEKIEFRVDSGGEIKWIEATVRCLTHPEVGALEVVGLVRDITDKKHQKKQLDAARERYQSVIEAAPDPILLASQSEGEIQQANGAAEELIGPPLTTNSSPSLLDIFPDENRSRYRSLLLEGATERTVREFEDGTPLEVKTDDGGTSPTQLNVEQVDIQGESYLLLICRISDAVRYERALTVANEFARDALQAQNESEVAELLVKKTQDELDMHGPAVHLFDAESGVLEPSAYPAEFDELIDVPEFQPGESIAWQVYENDGFKAIDDVRKHPDCMNPETRFRSELMSSIGSHGVLMATSEEPGVITDVEKRSLRLMARTMEAALDRINRFNEVQEKERQVEQSRDKLERSQKLNRQIRDTLQSILDARKHSVINSAVCDSLTGGPIAGTWYSTPNFADDQLEIQHYTGDVEDYLRKVEFDLLDTDVDEMDQPPSVKTCELRVPHEETSIPTGVQESDWRQAAVTQSKFKGIISVPVMYDNVLYGVLTVGVSEIDYVGHQLADALYDLGRLIGYSHHAVTQRNSLVGERSVDLVIDFHDADDILVDISDKLNSHLDIETVLTSENEGFQAFVQFEDGISSRAVESILSEHPLTENYQLFPDEDTLLAQITLYERSPLVKIADSGGNLNRASITPSGISTDVSLRRDQDTQEFVDRIQTHFSNASVSAHRDTDTVSAESISSPLDGLTDAQLRVLQTAWRSGYFEVPRRAKTSNIGDALDISQSRVSQQLRTGLGNVLELLLDS